jgi:hypothetical protein
MKYLTLLSIVLVMGCNRFYVRQSVDDRIYIVTSVIDRQAPFEVENVYKTYLPEYRATDTLVQQEKEKAQLIADKLNKLPK